MLKEGSLGNYEPKEMVGRVGPGEYGAPVTLVSPQEQTKRRTTMQEFGFNLAVSDKIAMDRAIPDTRPAECKRWKYPLNLPKTRSVQGDNRRFDMTALAELKGPTICICYRRIFVISNKGNLCKILQNCFCYWRNSVTGGSVIAGIDCISLKV